MNEIILNEGGKPLEFAITRRIAVGGSVICYKATHAGKTGTLREFRGDDPSRYLAKYELIKQVLRDNDEIKSFIPQVEIYFDENNRPYVWNIEPELETFADMCANFKTSNSDEAAYNFVLVLSATKYLTQCVCELHKVGLVHRDIKPSNFGFVRRGNELLTQTISIFDIDSICSVYSSPEDLTETPGFTDNSEPVSNLTDIYSIGATLFFALVGDRYIDDNFDDLPVIIEGCPVITNMPNVHPRLKLIVSDILRNCLCPGNKRYQSCEDLLKDLDKALYYAIPAELATRMNTHEMFWSDVQKYLVSHRKMDVALIFQHHLYETPLYRWQPADSRNLNILILGSGEYAQKFLDTCLSIGQIPDADLSIKIVGEDVEDFNLYLNRRPALPKFFSIGDEIQSDSYGHLQFLERKLYLDNVNESVFQDLICEFTDEQNPHYIFVALGNNQLNRFAAQACHEALEALEMSCGVCFVYEGTAKIDCDDNLIPIYVDEDIKNLSCHAEIKRQAFNVHLTWDKNLQVDYASIRKDFRKPDNFKSCILNAVSLKYKLHSLGIDAEPYECAEKFVKLNLGENQKLYDTLVYFEHRRWVAEKICDGWTKREIYECRDNGKTKDPKRKTDTCLVKSAPNQKLKREFINLSDWDKASGRQLDKLDDLDRMSVELHRFFVRQSKTYRESNILHSEQVIRLRNIVGSNREILTCLNEWLACLEDIQNGRRSRVFMYESLRATVIDKLKSLPADNRRDAKTQIEFLDKQFKFICESMKYENYKDIDAAMIHRAPFILTYTENIYLVIPYSSGNNTEIFSNIAANIVINAKKVIYLLQIQSVKDLTAIRNSLKRDMHGILHCARKKNLRAQFEFAIAYDDNRLGIEQISTLKNILENLGEIIHIKWLPFTDCADIPQIFTTCLRRYNNPNRLIALEGNSTPLSNVLKAGGVYKIFDSYEFDMTSQTFQTSGRCALLNYIGKPAYITVADLFSFKSSSVIPHDKPEFFSDYEKLWRLYRQDPSVWKELCNWLESADDNKVELATFKRLRPSNQETVADIFRYIIPIECRAAVEKIFKTLKKTNILDEDSRVVARTPSSCDVIVKTKSADTNSTWNKLFANPYNLLNPDAVEIKAKPSEVSIQFDGLIAQNLKPQNNQSVISLLNSLSAMNFITNLKTFHGKVSFTYATRQIKHLLTVAGRILEIYLYHKIAASGLFDDISCSCEIIWADTEANSEIDCILTKGLRSVFIECKARSAINQEYYYRLHSLMNQFGINAQAILVADTQEKSWQEIARTNEIQRQRGELVNVKTIWQPSEIDAIDETLLKILNDNEFSTP